MGGAAPVPFSEDHPTGAPLSAYAASKRSAELARASPGPRPALPTRDALP